jgi:hypothetical protein
MNVVMQMSESPSLSLLSLFTGVGVFINSLRIVSLQSTD